MQTFLFLDDNPDRHDQITKQWSDVYNIIHCWTIDDLRDALKTHDSFDVVSLDHDLGGFEHKSVDWDGRELTGLDACGFLVKHRHKLPPTIIIHSANPCGAHNMMAFLKCKGIQSVWQMFTCVDDIVDEV